jgi:hypothetical protein
MISPRAPAGALLPLCYHSRRCALLSCTCRPKGKKKCGQFVTTGRQVGELCGGLQCSPSNQRVVSVVLTAGPGSIPDPRRLIRMLEMLRCGQVSGANPAFSQIAPTRTSDSALAPTPSHSTPPRRV